MLRVRNCLAAFAAIFVLQAPASANDLPVVVYGGIHNYPGQQLCQVSRSDRRYRELCWPQSYHPYGAAGYRPMGTYRSYRSVRRAWIQPSAKIVQIHEQSQ